MFYLLVSVHCFYMHCSTLVFFLLLIYSVTLRMYNNYVYLFRLSLSFLCLCRWDILKLHLLPCKATLLKISTCNNFNDHYHMQWELQQYLQSQMWLIDSFEVRMYAITCFCTWLRLFTMEWYNCLHSYMQITRETLRPYVTEITAHNRLCLVALYVSCLRRQDWP